jgi:hypothetical protein
MMYGQDRPRGQTKAEEAEKEDLGWAAELEEEAMCGSGANGLKKK